MVLRERRLVARADRVGHGDQPADLAEVVQIVEVVEALVDLPGELELLLQIGVGHRGLGAAEVVAGRPRIRSGQPVAVPGVQYVFRYELENDSGQAQEQGQ